MECSRAQELLEAYSTDLTAFHDARLMLLEMSEADPKFSACQRVKEEAFAQVYAARKRYLSHVTEHGCHVAADAHETRLDIENRLRKEMREARDKFMAANDRFDQLIAIGLDASGSADGAFAREQASRLLQAAFKHYD